MPSVQYMDVNGIDMIEHDVNEEDVQANETLTPDENSPSRDLLFKLNDVPPVGIMVVIALQNVLMGLGGTLSTAYVISDAICAGPDHPIRAKLFCTSLFMTGVCTILQSLVGVRLPIYQGVCSTFLVPLLAMKTHSGWRCDEAPQSLSGISSVNDTVTYMNGSALSEHTDADMSRRLQEMMGCLMLASVFEVLVGATGLVGVLLRFIGPLTIASVVSLIGLSLYKIPMEYARTHWPTSAICIVLIGVPMLYFDKINMPLPVGCSKKEGKQTFIRVPVFQMFSVLLGILLTWALCAIFTAAGVYTEDPSNLDYRARSDVRNGVILITPWLYVPYPGQFGYPRFNITIFVGFLSAVISSILETIGDYYAAANISRSPPPPRHAVNRGIFLEGLGSVLSGAMGAGHATTSSTPHVALIGVTKVGSRSCLALAGVMCLVFSVIGKFGAVLSIIPDPAIGGAMFVVFGILGSLGLFTLRYVDMTSMRNLIIFGLSLYTGIVIPEWADRYSEFIDTGDKTSTGILQGVLGSPMLLGGAVSVILDNTVRGSRAERGIDYINSVPSSAGHPSDNSELKCYDLPFVNRLKEKCPFLFHLPFVQPRHQQLTSTAATS